MSNYCGRGGHTEAATGAVGSINELTEDRKVIKRVNELLREVGNSVKDVTPPEYYTFPSELNYGINETNRVNCDLFFSIHFNSCDGAKGSEICVYPNTPICNTVGTRILSNLANLGFVNRGLKPRTDLGELTSINCPSMIIEVCFVQEPDASLYRKLGVERISRAIANGIDSRVSLNNTPSKPVSVTKEKRRNIIVYQDGAIPDQNSAEFMAMILNFRKEDAVAIPVSKINQYEGGSVFAIGSARISANKTLRGNNRYETAENVLEHLIKTQK